MQLPDYEEALMIAGLVLGKQRFEVEGLIRVERLHQAILAPAAHASGAPIHRTAAEIAKCLFVECSLRRIFPTVDQGVQFGWLMTQRAVQLSGRRWRRARGHDERLEEIRQQLREGIDPGEPMLRWMAACISPPQNPPQDRSPGAILVSSPMHPPPPQDMKQLATAVDDGLNRFLEDRAMPGAIGTRRPQIYPALGETRQELHREVEERLHTADGLVVLAPCGSWGCAIELETGLRGMVPTLFLHPAASPPSPRTQSHLEAMEVTILAIDENLDEDRLPEGVEALVYQWLEGAYSVILGAQRRRVSVIARLSRFLAAIQAKKTQMTAYEELRELAAAGLPEERARTLIEEPWGLLSASTVELIALANAYQVPANIDAMVPEPRSDRPPYLTPRELVELEAFVDDMNISGPDSVRLAAAAQEELTTPGKRRKLFTDRSKWQDLWQRPGDR